MDRPKDIEVLERDTVYDGYFRVDRYRLRHATFAGPMSGTVTREIFERGHSAGLLPYDPARDEIVLIEQFRIGALAAVEANPWLVEIVAGIVEAGESPEEVVRRECAEESGVAVTDIVPICTMLPSPGGCSERCSLFCGRVDAAGAGGVHGLDTESEDIRVFTATPDETLTMIADGRIVNGIAIAALYWFALNRARIREAWQAP